MIALLFSLILLLQQTDPTCRIEVYGNKYFVPGQPMRLYYAAWSKGEMDEMTLQKISPGAKVWTARQTNQIFAQDTLVLSRPTTLELRLLEKNGTEFFTCRKKVELKVRHVFLPLIWR